MTKFNGCAWPYRRHTAITNKGKLPINLIMAVAILHHNYSCTPPVAFLTNIGSAVAFILKLTTRQHVLVDMVAEL